MIPFFRYTVMRLCDFLGESKNCVFSATTVRRFVTISYFLVIFWVKSLKPLLSLVCGWTGTSKVPVQYLSTTFFSGQVWTGTGQALDRYSFGYNPVVAWVVAKVDRLDR